MTFPMTRYRVVRTKNDSGTGTVETLSNAKTVFCRGFEVHQGTVRAIIGERTDVRVGDVLAIEQTLPGGE